MYKFIKIILFIIALLLFSCNKKETSIEKLKTSSVSLKQVNIPEGADPSVSAELGGNGFDGKGWETNSDYNIVGKKDSYKGGAVVMSIPEFPSTIRPFGQNSNTFFYLYCGNLLYETLLQLDPVTSKYIPMLATHWKIMDDKKTFKFRINPDARWADGNPVTSEDFVETWKMLRNPGILDPYTNELLDEYEEPVAESKYIFSVKSKTVSWRNFYYYAAEIQVFPAHFLKQITPEDFLQNYQYKYFPGTGPYAILDNEINKGNFISLHRRSDYWGEKEKFNQGRNNFDVITFASVSNDLLEYEKFKKGEIDIIPVRKASDWVEKFEFENVKRGLILKRRIFNESPKTISGICINIKKEPFNDINVRRAFIHAFNRKLFNEKLFFNSYNLMNSYFSGTVYENLGNPHLGYNLDSSALLLSRAGWTQKNSNGYLTKNGKVFEVELPYQTGMDRYLTIYQEDLKKVGVKANLREIDLAYTMKIGSEKNFTLLPITWNAVPIPNPESVYKSDLADSKNNNNWSGINDSRIDSLIDKYNFEFDLEKRIMYIRTIDSLLIEQAGYIFYWYAPYHRIVFHNMFDYPDGLLGRESGIESILPFWSFSPEKTEKYLEALKDNSISINSRETDNKYWLDKKKK